jgi:hypothetical protein
MLLRCESLEPPMSQRGHSRHGLHLPVVGRLPQCPESGRKGRARDVPGPEVLTRQPHLKSPKAEIDESC